MLKRFSLYTLLLCVVPIFTYFIDWHWQSNEVASLDYFLYFLTETGSTPYAIITCIAFALFYFVAIRDKKQAIWAIVIMACSVILTQGIKSGLKTMFSEPRPFVQEIVQNSDMSTDDFYAQKRHDRKKIVYQYYQETKTKQTAPDWLIEHHANETGYSFPSGHTMFAATWLLLVVGFAQLLGHRNPKIKLLVPVVTVWAVLMLVSRLRLGMHYSIDLLASILIAWFVHLIIFAYLQRKDIFVFDKI
ncbi:phosphatase PAP2 family protein [Histophilus somni]|uniref:undecaprenyl-diphosphate phosphatase n=1 Tax=Histophilus somni (strain 129Pt) TaxID=205914 RepID=Q0I4A4_HISS1|nr:phosphatase PAP2 family protein [Histophilus somni]QEH18079.1 phosphatase PAP2 family protein [Histophilus somni]THA22539.1 phosphatase PAP2 family protein [Histophilus somni]